MYVRSPLVVAVTSSSFRHMGHTYTYLVLPAYPAAFDCLLFTWYSTIGGGVCVSWTQTKLVRAVSGAMLVVCVRVCWTQMKLVRAVSGAIPSYVTRKKKRG